MGQHEAAGYGGASELKPNTKCFLPYPPNRCRPLGVLHQHSPDTLGDVWEQVTERVPCLQLDVHLQQSDAKGNKQGVEW